MAEILSHPFRLTGAGTIATVEQQTDQAHAEQLGVLMLTRPGERVLVPTFGLSDPAFRGFDASELVSAIETFGPPVSVNDVTVVPLDDMTQEVRVEFA